MTRHTVSLAPSGAAVHDSDELARAATTAAALIELAVHESLAPMEMLGQALARVAAAAGETAGEWRADLTVCIESLQFHDRMVQQLTQVRDLLAGAMGTRPVTADPTAWPQLRERLRAHFTSKSHRLLFDLLMLDEGHGVTTNLDAEEGSVELF